VDADLPASPHDESPFRALADNGVRSLSATQTVTNTGAAAALTGIMCSATNGFATWETTAERPIARIQSRPQRSHVVDRARRQHIFVNGTSWDDQDNAPSR